MERDNYTKMLQSLKVYKQVGGLLKMTREQLKNMPKEVMITLSANEIALVWDKLPDHVKNDSEMLKYRFCHEHHSSSDQDIDENDGPPPRKIFCCYCKISDVNITAENPIQLSEQKSNSNICKQQ